MIEYEAEGERLKDQTPCAGLRASLKMCLLDSDCCKKFKKTPRECLKNPDNNVPEECFGLRNAFFECKRSIVSKSSMDNRIRFRGRKGY